MRSWLSHQKTRPRANPTTRKTIISIDMLHQFKFFSVPPTSRVHRAKAREQMHCTNNQFINSSFGDDRSFRDQHSPRFETSDCTSSCMGGIVDLNNAGALCIQNGRIGDAVELLRRGLHKSRKISPFSISVGKMNRRSSQHDKMSKNLYIYQREYYDEGLGVFNDAVHVNSLASIHTIVATLSFNLGQAFARIAEDDEAMKFFNQALAVLDASRCRKAESGASVVGILHNMSRIEYQNGRYEDAIRFARKSVAFARSNYEGRMHEMLEMSSLLNGLGVYVFHVADPCETNEAMDLYHESLTLRRVVLGADAVTKEIATTLNNIGRVHYVRGEHDEALHAYIGALQMRRTIFGNDHLDVAASVYNAGQAHHQRGDLEEAMKLYNEFLTTGKRLLGGEHRDVAMMLKCIAQIHHEKHEYDAAKIKYNEALAIGRAALGPNHPEVAVTLNKLGNLFYETGDFVEAIRVYQEGLAVERTVLDAYHPNIVITLTNIGQIHKLRGEHRAALAHYKEAVSIQRRKFGPHHPNTASTLATIALIYYQTRAYSKSLEVYQESLRIRREVFGDETLEVASSLNSIGLVLFKMELHDMAMQVFFHSLEIRRKILGDAHRDVAVILHNIATVNIEIGNEEDAVHYYRETLKVEQAALGRSHRDVLLTMQHIGQVHQQRGEIEEALSYFMQSLKIQQESKSRDPMHCARTWTHIGNLYLRRGETHRMMHAFSEALRILRDNGNSEIDMHIIGFNFYGLSKMHPECASCA
jgi:tetratricopeptide (TPR) repeat protein